MGARRRSRRERLVPVAGAQDWEGLASDGRPVERRSSGGLKCSARDS